MHARAGPTAAWKSNWPPSQTTDFWSEFSVRKRNRRQKMIGTLGSKYETGDSWQLTNCEGLFIERTLLRCTWLFLKIKYTSICEMYQFWWNHDCSGCNGSFSLCPFAHMQILVMIENLSITSIHTWECDCRSSWKQMDGWGGVVYWDRCEGWTGERWGQGRPTCQPSDSLIV